MALKSNKVVITCAVTGSIHTPTMTPYLPLTPDEIAQQSIEAAEAGAAIIHLHTPQGAPVGHGTATRGCRGRLAIAAHSHIRVGSYAEIMRRGSEPLTPASIACDAGLAIRRKAARLRQGAAVIGAAAGWPA